MRSITLISIGQPITAQRVEEALRELDRYWEKGALYLSPLLNGVALQGDEKRELVLDLREVKLRARMPTFLYLIQRL